VALKPTFILFDSTKNSYSVWGVKSPENPDSYSSFCYDYFLKMLDVPDSYVEIQSFFLNAKLHLF